MLAEALDHAGRQSGTRVRERMQLRIDAGETAFSALVNEYLSGQRMAELELGCPVAALSSDMQRAQDALRDGARSREALLAQYDRPGPSARGEERRAPGAG